MLKNSTIRTGNDIEGDIKYFTEFMSQDKPLFFNRVGGIEYYIAGEYFQFKDNKIIDDANWVNTRLELLKKFPGYFDFANDTKNLEDYLEKTIGFFKNSDDMSYVDALMESSFSSNSFLLRDEIFLNEIANGKTIINSWFFGNICPFMESFSAWGKDKTILIISPLSKSITHQYKNKDKLYNDYKFPEFELKTYNTKITYNTIGDTKSTLNITTNNWQEECLRISEEISKIDFDVAFLSCGIYAMFLGDFIKHIMGKKSIYIGGILNVLFNIYGGRFNDDFYLNRGLNLEYQINPFENSDIINIKGGRDSGPGESLNAYFGTRR